MAFDSVFKSLSSNNRKMLTAFLPGALLTVVILSWRLVDYRKGQAFESWPFLDVGSFLTTLLILALGLLFLSLTLRQFGENRFTLRWMIIWILIVAGAWAACYLPIIPGFKEGMKHRIQSEISEATFLRLAQDARLEVSKKDAKSLSNIDLTSRYPFLAQLSDEDPLISADSQGVNIFWQSDDEGGFGIRIMDDKIKKPAQFIESFIQVYERIWIYEE